MPKFQSQPDAYEDAPAFPAIVLRLSSDSGRAKLSSAVRRLLRPDESLDLRIAASAGKWRRATAENANALDASSSVEAELAINGVQFTKVVIRLKGGGTRVGIPQGRPPLRVTFRQKNLFPVQELSLNNNIYDASFMRDALSYKLFSDFGVPAPKTAYVKLYVSFPGSTEKRYLGLYTASEVVDQQFVQARFGDSAGFIMKPNLANHSFPQHISWKDHEAILGPRTQATPAQQERMLRFIRLVNESDAATFRTQIDSYMDIDNYLRFLVVNVVLANLDSYLGMGKNYFMYLHPSTAKLHWIPWDHDLSFGGFFLCGSTEERINLSIDDPSSVNDALLKRLFAIPEIKERYHQLLREFLARHFQFATISREIDQLAQMIKPAVLEKKAQTRAEFEPGIDGRRAGAGARPPRALFDEVQPGLKTFVERRIQSIQAQLDGKSQGSRPTFWR
jgi:spore coat protein H